jgi:hypothetical protein
MVKKSAKQKITDILTKDIQANTFNELEGHDVSKHNALEDFANRMAILFFTKGGKQTDMIQHAWKNLKQDDRDAIIKHFGGEEGAVYFGIVASEAIRKAAKTAIKITAAEKVIKILSGSLGDMIQKRMGGMEGEASSGDEFDEPITPRQSRKVGFLN